jgi:hypothetical protein
MALWLSLRQFMVDTTFLILLIVYYDKAKPEMKHYDFWFGCYDKIVSANRRHCEFIGDKV